MSTRLPSPRQCHRCLKLIAEHGPVVFVQRGKGKLRGPFHAQCAEGLVKTWRGKASIESDNGRELLVTLHKFDQEELPW